MKTYQGQPGKAKYKKTIVENPLETYVSVARCHWMEKCKNIIYKQTVANLTFSRLYYRNVLKYNFLFNTFLFVFEHVSYCRKHRR